MHTVYEDHMVSYGILLGNRHHNRDEASRAPSAVRTRTGTMPSSVSSQLTYLVTALCSPTMSAMGLAVFKIQQKGYMMKLIKSSQRVEKDRKFEEKDTTSN